MTRQSVNIAIQAWLNSIDATWPIFAVSPSPDAGGLNRLIAEHDEIARTEMEAVLWLRIGMIDRAHKIVQDGTQGFQAYLHGVVHRLEGDYWNSKYWFRQVRNDMLLKRIGEGIVEHLSKSNYYGLACARSIIQSQKIDFAALVDTCEVYSTIPLDPHKNQHELTLMLQQIAMFEWLCLLEIATAVPSQGLR